MVEFKPIRKAEVADRRIASADLYVRAERSMVVVGNRVLTCYLRSSEVRVRVVSGPAREFLVGICSAAELCMNADVVLWGAGGLVLGEREKSRSR